MTNLLTLTESNFKKTIEENEFVIVDFWAKWCKPCVAFTPIFEAAAKKNKKKWEWPTDGEVTSPFNQAADKKGIEILGLEGQEIRSAAKGKVIYVGKDLAGYGKLTIIKHDDDILSVYGHQQSSLITEGQAVEAGQTIGTMGKTGTDEVKLLFEIRKNGESINPINLLKNIP